MFDDLLFRLRSIFRRTTVENELDDELHFHFDRLVSQHTQAGLPLHEARRRAHLAFGGMNQVKEDCRDARGTQVLDSLLQDFRYCLRMLRKSPGFAAIAVLTLALGIGANTTIFSVLESVLLRSLPVSHPEQLVVLTDPDEHGAQFGSQTGDRSLLAYSEFEYLRDHNSVFSGIFAADSDLATREIRIGDSAGSENQKQDARVKLVSGAYFSTLGVKPAAGRTFDSQADRARGGAPIAVVSYGFWERRFGLSPSILGKSIQIHNTSFEIIGVAPPGFFGETVGEAADVWVPMMMQDSIYPGRDYLSPSPQGLVNEYEWIQVIGRLKPGVSVAQAKAAINVNFQQCLEAAAGATADPKGSGHDIDQRLDAKAGGRGSSTLRGHFGQPLKFLMVLVGLVLLIACANVANLLLARGAARQKEFAMRLAIGAGRARLIRQLLTESLILAALGAIAGVGVSFWAQTLLVRMVSGSTAAVHLDLHPDWKVLAFTAGVTVLTAILFGLVPAIQLTRFDLTPALKSTSQQIKTESIPVRFSMAKLLVVAQVAVSLILLVAAGLFVRSLVRLSQVNLGYNRENLLLFRVDAAGAGYKGPAAVQLYQQLLANLGAISGLRGVTASENGLFSGTESGDPIAVEGYVPKPGERMNSSMDHVGPKYFSTVGIPILMGREINASDGSGMRAAVINETFAKHFFPNANPIGRHVRDTYSGNPTDLEVVGVVSDVKYNSLREKGVARLYAPLFHPMWDEDGAVFEVRTLAEPSAVSASIRQAVQTTSATIPPIEIHTMSGLVDNSLQTDRFIEQLSEAFGLLAALLAAIGLYGVMAYSVARRTREIGIRLALGAEPGTIRWNILRETLSPVVVGIALGLPVALLGTHLVRSMVFGIGFADPVAIALAAVLLIGVAALAGFLPAGRAANVDPIIALRYE